MLEKSKTTLKYASIGLVAVPSVNWGRKHKIQKKREEKEKEEKQNTWLGLFAKFQIFETGNWHLV